VGRPAAGAEVAVAIVDDSLYVLYSDPSAPLAPYFHPLRRNDVATGGPLQLLSTAWRRPTLAPGKRLSEGSARLAGRGSAGGRAPPPPSAPAAPAPEPAPRGIGGDPGGGPAPGPPGAPAPPAGARAGRPP